MNALKRAWSSLINAKLQFIGIVVIFTAMFVISLICLIVYNTTNESIGLSEKAIANAITIQPPVVIGPNLLADSTSISETSAALMLKSDYIQEYNTIVQYYDFFNRKEEKKEDKKEEDTLSITAIQNSAYYEAFSSGSWYLREGKHFSSKDGAINEILISDVYADANKLHVGDTITLSQTELALVGYMENSKKTELEVKIRGIYTSDDKEAIRHSANWIYIPYDTLVSYWYRAYDGLSRISVHVINKVVVYLKNSSDVEPYLKYLKENINVEQISDVTEGINYHNMDEIKAGTYNATDPAELSRLYSSTVLGMFNYEPWYYILLNRGWFTMVARPLEQIRDIMKWSGMILGGATFLLMVMICSFTLRRRNREFGILLSLGERKGRILWQVVAETMIMVFIAAVIGIVSAPSLTKKYGNEILASTSERYNLESKKEKQEYQYKLYRQKTAFVESYNGKNEGGTVVSLSNTANVQAKSHLEFTVDAKVVVIYFGVVVGMILVTMLLQGVYILRISPAELIRR